MKFDVVSVTPSSGGAIIVVQGPHARYPGGNRVEPEEMPVVREFFGITKNGDISAIVGMSFTTATDCDEIVAVRKLVDGQATRA